MEIDDSQSDAVFTEQSEGNVRISDSSRLFV